VSAQIFAIANEKGGVAKTTTAVHLGHALARGGKKVLIVDIDPQSNATSWIGADRPAAVLANVLLNPALAAEAIARSTADGVDLLWSTRDTAGAGDDLRNFPAPAVALRRALRTINGRYDVILVDCAPGLGIVTINGIVAANGIIAPVDSGSMAVAGLEQLRVTIAELVEAELMPAAIPVTALVTRYDGRLALAKSVLEHIDNSGIPRFETVIRNGTKVGQAPGFERTLFDLDPRDNVALDYASLGEEIALALESIHV
jgi:chromosome partitioning protein